MGCVLSGKSLDFRQKCQYSNCYQIHKLKDNIRKLANFPIIGYFKNIIFFWMGNARVYEGADGKVRSRLKKNFDFFQENQVQLFQFFPGRVETPFNILDPNYLSLSKHLNLITLPYV